MSHNKDIGKKGEKIAERYLKRHGYIILERNFLVRGSEIDIIAEKNDEIHFIEVKTRTERSLGDPIEAVTYYKRKALIHGAKVYLMKNQKYYERICSFDVCEIILLRKLIFNKKINYIENAFEEERR